MHKRLFGSIVAAIFALAVLFSPSAPLAQAAGQLTPSYVTAHASGVMITKYPGSVRHGAYAIISVKAAPRASCSINVYYKSGASVAAGLYRKTATSSGAVSWTWKVGTRTTPGSWPVVVTCGGSTAQTVVNVR